MNNNFKLITIAIPTYNRAIYLDKLLNNLSKEINTISDFLTVMVSNNASTDDTVLVLNKYKILIPSLIVINHDHNLGPDENFSFCFDHCNSKYFWLFGDDDIFELNSIIKIIKIITQKKPDFIYIKSKWVNETLPNLYFNDDIHYYEFYDKYEFCCLVNTWLGFITGCIINKEKLLILNKSFFTRQFHGTYLPQLSWTLNMVKYGNNFIYITSPIIYATKHNINNPPINIGIFGYFYPEILKIVFFENFKLQKKLLDMMICNIFLSLLWRWEDKPFSNYNNEKYIKNTNADTAENTKKFQSHNITWEKIKNNLNFSYYFILLTVPINYLPKYISIFFVIIGKLFFLVKIKKIIFLNTFYKS